MGTGGGRTGENITFDAIDIDVLLRIIASGRNSSVGSERWATAIRGVLRQMSNIVFGDARPTEDDPRFDVLQQGLIFLEDMQRSAPEQFNVIFGEVGAELNLIDPEGLGTNVLDIGRILADALGGAGGRELQDIVSTIETEVDRVRDEITNVSVTGETQITEQRDVFVDIPTPEEVLNDFRTGVFTYTENLFESGLIDSDTRSFLFENPTILLAPYLAALGQRAAAGENIFDVVGTDFELIPIEQIGERFGGELLQDIERTVTEIEEGTLTIEELTERVQNNLLSGTEDPDQQQEIRETINEIFTQSSTGATTTQTVTNLLQLTTERIFQRPNLTTVFSLSPVDFLQERFTATGLMTLAATEPGRQNFNRQFSGGVAPSGSRRLG